MAVRHSLGGQRPRIGSGLRPCTSAGTLSPVASRNVGASVHAANADATAAASAREALRGSPGACSATSGPPA